MATNGIFQLITGDAVPDKICRDIRQNIILESDITLPNYLYKKYKLRTEDGYICIYPDTGCSSKIKLNYTITISAQYKL